MPLAQLPKFYLKLSKALSLPLSLLIAGLPVFDFNHKSFMAAFHSSSVQRCTHSARIFSAIEKHRLPVAFED